jgi:probable HAF family extracellular repeat protein
MKISTKKRLFSKSCLVVLLTMLLGLIGQTRQANAVMPDACTRKVTVQDLGAGQAKAVNDSGQVVGYSGSGAFSWTQAGGMVDLGAGQANAVNGSGQVVGWSTTASGESRAVIWMVTTEVPTPPVARCKNVTVPEGSDASVNDGSYDPNGYSITLIQSPPGPYPLGATRVALTVTNSCGLSASCSAIVTGTETAPVARCRNVTVLTEPGVCVV